MPNHTLGNINIGYGLVDSGYQDSQTDISSLYASISNLDQNQENCVNDFKICSIIHYSPVLVW